MFTASLTSYWYVYRIQCNYIDNNVCEKQSDMIDSNVKIWIQQLTLCLNFIKIKYPYNLSLSTY